MCTATSTKIAERVTYFDVFFENNPAKNETSLKFTLKWLKFFRSYQLAIQLTCFRYHKLSMVKIQCTGMGLILCPDFTYSSSLEGEPERKSNRFCEAIYDFFFKSMFPIFFLGRSTQGVKKVQRHYTITYNFSSNDHSILKLHRFQKLFNIKVPIM